MLHALRRSLAALPLLLALALPAQASLYASVRGWDIEYKAGETLLCGMSAEFDDGVTVGIALMHAGPGRVGIGLVLSKPSWQMGQIADPMLRVSVVGWFDHEAPVAVAPSTVVAVLPFEPTVLDGIALGSEVQVRTPRRVYRYSLDGAAAAWLKTHECFDSLRAALAPETTAASVDDAPF